MRQRLTLLGALLVVQLVLIGVVYVASGHEKAGEQLLDIDAGAIHGLEISDAEGNTITLGRTDSGWQVGELPADAEKVDGVIESLVSGAGGWPVATSEDSQTRFEVTGDKFQRRIAFEGEGDELAVVYLGTSPGFRRVHARRDGEDEVFSIDFAVHEVPTKAGDWLDKQVLAAKGISRIELPGPHVLEPAGEEGGWTLDGQATDPEAARRFAERLEGLTVLGLYQPEKEKTLGDAQTVVIQDERGTERLTFRFDEAGDQYVVTSDRVPGEFTVASYVAEQIFADPSDLLPKADDGGEAAGEGESDAGAPDTPTTPSAEEAS
ncbi:MAG: DUF4340 domain-containing protein [Pseudomonadales bacterium]|jgi:hypothetical protein